MQRYQQTEYELLSKVSKLESSWKDKLASEVVEELGKLPGNVDQALESIKILLTNNFKCGIMLSRLLLDLSKDQFQAAMNDAFGDGGSGYKRFKQDPIAYFGVLERLGLRINLEQHMGKPAVWTDVIIERLKAGRGSAIVGQQRGRELEQATEAVVRSVFGKCVSKQCRFQGRDGKDEKADFAVPGKENPRIVIEVKGYGATGSKQTDILGDVERIISVKRPDTNLLLVIDGITWKARANDLRKLIRLQNAGDITRIYTKQMFPDLAIDLAQLKAEHHLMDCLPEKTVDIEKLADPESVPSESETGLS